MGNKFVVMVVFLLIFNNSFLEQKYYLDVRLILLLMGMFLLINFVMDRLKDLGVFKFFISDDDLSNSFKLSLLKFVLLVFLGVIVCE